jgi:hypothetical protein
VDPRPPSPASPPSRDDNNVKVLLVACAVAIVVVLVGGFVLLRGAGDDDASEEATAGASTASEGAPDGLVEMCRNGAPAGAAYTSSPGFHGARAYIGSDAGAWEPEPLPDSWQREETELVACAKRIEATPAGHCTLESGPGNPRLFQMHATRYSVVIYDAGTANALVRTTLDGSDTSCPSVAIIKPNQTALYADPQGLDELLRPFVEVAHETGEVPLGRPATLPSDLPPECPAPPFDVTVADGPDVRPLSVPGAVIVERSEGRQDRVEVWLAGFPFSAEDVVNDDPPFAGRGTWLVLHFSREGASIDASVFEAGDVVAYAGAPPTASYRVAPELHPNTYAERKNADPSAVVQQSGDVKILHVDDEVVCMAMALTSNLGTSATGRITATRS